MNDLDLDIENYSINDIRTLFGLKDNYTQDSLQENVDTYLNMVGDRDEISPKNKKRISQFLNSLRVTLIRHLNNSGFPRARGAYQCHSFSRLDGQFYLVQD